MGNNTLEGGIAKSIAVLDEQRRVLRTAGAQFAAELLDIALLELRRQHYGVSDNELAQFAAVVERQLISRVAVDPARHDADAPDVVALSAETN